MPRPVLKGGTERTNSLPGLVEAFAALPARNVVIDGELCLCDDHGRPNFPSRCASGGLP